MDGINDVVVGSKSVGAFIIYGSAVPFQSIYLSNSGSYEGLHITHSVSYTLLGYSVVENSDVNHDGISDVALGCPLSPLRQYVFVVYGRPQLPMQNKVIDVMRMSPKEGMVIKSSPNERTGCHRQGGFYLNLIPL